jgi:hypothetical protein
MSSASKSFIHLGWSVALLLLVMGSVGAYAQVMQSTNYKLQSDSINFGGSRSSSSNYTSEDTLGEVATGFSSSTNYALAAGYQEMQTIYLALTAASNVTLSPNILGITGGTSNGETTVTATTDNLAGYTLSLTASSSPALVSANGDSFADYIPSGANPDFTFSIPALASEFAFSPEGTDIAQRYRDNGSSCNAGSSDTVDACWDALSTSPVIITSRTSSNHPGGTITKVKFRAQVASGRNQRAGTYFATTTITMLPQ